MTTRQQTDPQATNGDHPASAAVPVPVALESLGGEVEVGRDPRLFGVFVGRQRRVG